MNPEPPSQSAMDKLRMESRVEARMLKTDKPITDEQRTELIRELADYRKTHAKAGKPLSWRRIARHVGVSESVLTETVKGKYSGDVDGVLRKIDEFLASENERGAKPNIREFQFTEFVEGVHAAVKQAILRRSIGVVTAEPGSGKTLFAEYLRDQHEGAVLITCKPSDRDGRFIIDALYRELGIKTYCRFTREKAREIEAYLQSHTNTIVIVDEGQHLSNDALEQLRSFHDTSDPGGRRNVPVVIFGDHNFYKAILGARGGRERTPFSPQITSRMYPIFAAEIHGVQRDDDGEPLPDAVFTRADIERIVKQGRLKLFRGDALAFAVKLANFHNWGRLRLAVRVLETAIDLNRGPQVTLDDMHQALSLCVPMAEAETIIDSIGTEKAAPRVAVAGGA